MINCEKLSLGLVAATILATPAMAQGIKQELGAPAFTIRTRATSQEATV